MFKVHRQCHPVRTLIDGTQCGACLKEYFTHGKLKAHLIRSAACRQTVLGRHISVPPQPGLGSTQDHDRFQAWDGRLPPLRAEGPRLSPGALRDFPHEHSGLFHQASVLIAALDDTSVYSFTKDLRALVETIPISWTSLCSTLSELRSYFVPEEMGLSSAIASRVFETLDLLASSRAWPFLELGNSSRPATSGTSRSLQQIESTLRTMTSPEPVTVPHPCTRERIFLHVFSGRRRAGDLQFYLERLYQSEQMEGVSMVVVSLDLMVDADWGDVRRPTTQKFWLDGARAGWICGGLCGPPCETWSQARVAAVNKLTARGPRPLRAIDFLWGLSSLSLKEAQQIAVGNELLLFSLELLLEIYIAGGFGVLEHPQEPEDPDRPSIWRLAVVQLLCTLPDVEYVNLAQGLFGALSPKPTRLMALRLPWLMDHLRRHHVAQDLPRGSAIGLDAHGCWRTSPLKEYPPALNRGLASAFCAWFQHHPVQPDVTVEPSFLSKCHAMSQTTYGTRIGPDYGGT